MPAKSKNQQEFFGLALSVKRGETARSEVSDDVLKVVDSMSEKEIEDFAETKHKGLPTKVKKEGVIKLKDLLEWYPGQEDELYNLVDKYENELKRTDPFSELKPILQSLTKSLERQIEDVKITYSMGGMATGQTARVGDNRMITVNVHMNGDDLTSVEIPLDEPLSNKTRDIIGKLRRASRTGYRV